MRGSITTFLSFLLILTAPALAAAPTALVATINATPYDADFLIDGHRVAAVPGGRIGDMPLLWRLTPGHWHTLSVVTTAGYAYGNRHDISTYDKRILRRCSVRIKPKAGDDYILFPGLPGQTGDCPLMKFDHEYSGDLND